MAAVATEFQMTYQLGRGWKPVDEQAMRRSLATAHPDVDAVVAYLRREPKGYVHGPRGSFYRRNPKFRPPNPLCPVSGTP